ncbi:[protein-PII] uridylyltransferase [Geomonas sp. Red69]|uniref:Bifunctional uridylyltransferase/uridylyl-removing enzyme n=1 Tax=Geomonas diazotrophica TaxID=2843197 RepID=A0ABX8JF38_9BACT|nr:MULTISPECIES: [protein-PII] uridylyltransferase [Geomonas]MBU5637374.1 [protein-PII] uridylyltransferase [Geomonas diazotrophica]QWV95812.1 [protein-PII] uridylyltransferase [Geomonas nitrogeniifigens]QXE84884.1 [protein-PII] uridylyltransferase [Geomonas nitrogeniifigens]
MRLNINAYLSEAMKGNGRSFEEKRGAYLAAAREFLEHFREESKRSHREGEDGISVVQSITAMTDALVTRLFTALSDDLQMHKSGQLALIAVGGYGRRELNPYSDLDLLFLYSGKDSKVVEEAANRLLYFLWDLRLDVGYSVRTIADCVDMAANDVTVKTALLDSRLLIGSDHLYGELKKMMVTQVLAKRSDAFINEKLEELRKRREKYGSSVYILEPNIKEGEGCLRDLHTAMWVAKIKYKVDEPRELVIKGVLSEEELGMYYSSLSYLWRIRNELHYLAGRKNDQLTFEAQTSIARFFGYEDKGKTLAVEQFMQDFYLHANRVEHFSSLLITKCSQREDSTRKILGYFTRRPVGDGFYVMKGELVVPDETVVDKDPVRLIKIFEHAQKQGVALALGTKTLIRNSLDLVNDKFRRSKEANASFFNILQSEKKVYDTLQQMHHLGFLNRFIPEFERIYCKVQHDVYHIYTVDTHTLFAVEELAKLWRGEHKTTLPLLTQLAMEVDKRWLLLLAVLLHDVGKGGGGGHAELGAELSKTIARRMGLSKEDSERLQFLVRQHLLLAHIAQRRDLHDERMIIQFARQMEKSENLKMLYLLTYADIKAVGPEVWTEWKALLLQELYEKAFQVLERGDFKLEASGDRVRRVKRTVFDLLADDYPGQLIKDELQALTTRHLLSYAPEIIAGHVRTLLALPSKLLVLQVSHEVEKGYTNCTVCTFDIPGLFSMITGVMAANGMNILGAQIHTNTNEKVLDILQVNSPQGFVITEESRWARFESDLRQVLEGKVRVGQLVAKRHRPSILTEKAKPTVPARVEIDNEVSSDYTVIDIYAHDKVGLLYSITSTLTRLGLYIGVSKISTKVDQVADVFYVKNIFGQKISEPGKLEEIRKELLAAVDG